MKFILQIDCGNAAFRDNGIRNEIPRILVKAARQISTSDAYERRCFDDNGNRVGSWKIITDQEEITPF